jgi:glycosyltransferase 2 family protein
VKRGRVLLAAKAAFGLALIAALASSVDWHAVGEVFARISPAPLVALVAVALLMIVVSCWKWKMLLESQGLRLPGGYLLATYFVGYFFTNFLPTGIGGDAVRALRVGKVTGRRGASLLAVFFERFTGLIALLTWVVALPLVNPAVLHSAPLVVIIVAAAGGLALLLLAGLRGEAIYGLVVKALPQGAIAEKAALLARHFHEFRMGRALTLRVAAVTVLFYALTFVNVLLGFRAFGIAVSALDVATYTPVVMFISMVPFSISSIGIAEGAYVFCFLLAGVPREASLSVALIMRLKLVALGLVGGAVYLLSKNAQPRAEGVAGCSNHPE